MANKKIIVIGGSAAGPKAASKARRLDQFAEITMIQKGPHLSMASCGYPYFVGGVFDKQSQMVREPSAFHNTKDINALVNTEVTKINRKEKTVEAKNLGTGETRLYSYDKLVIATGASPVVPPLPGYQLDGLTTLQSVKNATYLKNVVINKGAKHAVIVGGGLIGIETAEALQLAGLEVTVVERMNQILGFMDEDMAKLVENHIKEKGSNVLTGISVTEYVDRGDGHVGSVKLSDGREIQCDLAVVSVGVRPNTKLAQAAGLEVGKWGGLVTNKYMQTTDPDIYAAGDCAEVNNMVDNTPIFMPMGDAANLQARIVAQNVVLGNKIEYPGLVNTAICKAYDYTVGSTGLSERMANQKGIEVETSISAGPDKPGFMGGKMIVIKMVAEKATGRLLGTQAIGPGDASKRLAVAATAITAKMNVSQLVSLDLPYAPPFSPAIDNFITAAHVIENKLLGRMVGITAQKVKQRLDEGDKSMFMLDVRNLDEYEDVRIGRGETLIPLGTLRRRTDQLPQDLNREIITYCKVSLRGYEAATYLESLGYTNVKVMEGGITVWPFEVESGPVAAHDDSLEPA